MFDRLKAVCAAWQQCSDRMLATLTNNAPLFMLRLRCTPSSTAGVSAAEPAQMFAVPPDRQQRSALIAFRDRKHAATVAKRVKSRNLQRAIVRPENTPDKVVLYNYCSTLAQSKRTCYRPVRPSDICIDVAVFDEARSMASLNQMDLVIVDEIQLPADPAGKSAVPAPGGPTVSMTVVHVRCPTPDLDIRRCHLEFLASGSTPDYKLAADLLQFNGLVSPVAGAAAAAQQDDNDTDDDLPLMR